MEVIGYGARARPTRHRAEQNGAERLMGVPCASLDSNIFNGLFRASYLNAIPRYLTVVWTHHRASVSLTYPTGRELSQRRKNKKKGQKKGRDEEEVEEEESSSKMFRISFG